MGKYRIKTINYTKIALFVEIALFAIGGIVLLIIDGMGKDINYIPVLIVTLVLIFALLLTLSLAKYKAMRDIRETFKDSNVPIYTHNTDMLFHDIIDEEKEKK